MPEIAVLRTLETKLLDEPDGVASLLTWLASAFGPKVASASANRLAAETNVCAATLSELAHFRYNYEEYIVGDALLDRAKQLAPTLLRIFEEEAWNQRHRGNVHREIQAVKRCIELAKTPQLVLFWEIWLGQALLRRNDPESAWQYLARFSELPVGDDRAFSALSCARQLGHFDLATAALHHAAPGPLGEPDREHAAIIYLTQHPSPADAEWVLSPPASPLNATARTRMLELGAQTALRTGRYDDALLRIALAAERTDHGGWVPGFHGMLLELLGRPADAIQAYQVGSVSHPLQRFRLGALLVQSGNLRAAVTKVLAYPRPALKAWASLSGGEVDPMLCELIERDPKFPWAQNEIRQIPRRASSTALRAQASWILAEQNARAGKWEDAWRSIVAAQDLRLPAVPFTQLDQITYPVTPEVRYAEFCESEPVSRDTIFYESELGNATSGDPLALCLAILQDAAKSEFAHVWGVARETILHPALQGHSNVSFVRKGSPGYLRILATAGFFITDGALPPVFSKRLEQRVISCWHGAPWEPHGRERTHARASHGNITRNFLHADVVLCTDTETLISLPRSMDVDQLRPEAFVYADAPRLDLTVKLSATRREEIRTTLDPRVIRHEPINSVPAYELPGPLLLYVPHMPSFATENLPVSLLEVSRELASLGAGVIIHIPQLYLRDFAGLALPTNVTLAGPSFDLNELLGATDGVVSEGSIVLADAANAGIPAVALSTNKKLPGIKAISPSAALGQLLQLIKDKSLGQGMGATSGADGSAAHHATALVFGEIATARSSTAASSHPISRALFISTDGFPNNGITQSLRSLLAALASTDCTVYLRPWAEALMHADTELSDELFTRARLLIGVGKPAGTLMEHEALQFFNSRNYIDAPLIRELLVSERLREGHRRFGSACFAGALEFTAYLSSSIALTAYGVPVSGKRGVILHNEMWQEICAKYPQLRAGMSVLSEFDFIASVSDGVREVNSKELSARFGTRPDRHITIENTIDIERIRTLAATPLSSEDLAWYARPGRHACVIARMSPEKNHEQLLRVLAAERGRLNPQVLLTLLGDGPLRAKLEQITNDLGLANNVRFAGYVEAPQAHLREADVLLLPSLHEGQPLVILDALTVGKPVIATDTAGSRSVLADGRFGTLVPVSAAGLALALEQISSNAFTSTGDFDPEAFTSHSLRQLLSELGFSSPEDLDV